MFSITVSGQEVPATDLEPLAQRYMTVQLAESAFRGLSGFLEDWICGLARLWLTAYPKQLDAAYNEAADRTRAQRREEIQVPLWILLAIAGASLGCWYGGRRISSRDRHTR